jgi:hypothetical protein
MNRTLGRLARLAMNLLGIFWMSRALTPSAQVMSIA